MNGTMEATMGNTAGTCFDCGNQSADEVCSVCLALCDEIASRERYCRVEHGGDAFCSCVENSAAYREYHERLRPCTPAEHEALKSSVYRFALGTKRLPHHQHAEAYQSDGNGGELHYRNCRRCSSTLVMVFRDVCDAKVAA